ncbi:DUF354 domain-containing protein [candidate division KSB1 bacterium]|nr:DUF354 domain-containing protein [candidate division KSB1 bacterium]RQW01182.1 MAG: DUF354 domain-containing protein [candidate division KSB1 bacterium]
MQAFLIGRHYGKHKLFKIIGCLYRLLQLAPTILKEKPDAAVSHGSRSMLFLAKILRIPLITLYDYEYGQTLPFIKPDLLITPDIVSYVPFYATNVLKYNGIKEDVYVPFFTPNAKIKSDFNIDDRSIVVTLRPPATEAHYHNSDSELLFDEVINFLSEKKDITMVVLPRNNKQAEEIRKKWAGMYKEGKMIIPLHALDGLNIVWHSDVLISGGGTMNREAAALGVPVYSIFRGKKGAVDLFLEEEGKLFFIENSHDIRNKIILKKRSRTAGLPHTNNKVLEQIISFIILFLEKPAEIKSYQSETVQFYKHLSLNLKKKHAV